MKTTNLMKIAALAVMVPALASCDSRSDVYMSSVEPVTLSLPGGEIEKTAQGEYRMELSNEHAAVLTVSYDESEQPEAVTVECSAEVTGGEASDFGFRYDEAKKQLSISNNIPAYNDRDTLSLPSLEIILKVSDYFGREDLVRLVVQARPNKAVGFTLKCEKAGDGKVPEGEGYEYVISAEDVTDPEGLEAELFEFCIDGTLLFEGEGYDHEDFEGDEGPNSGCAAAAGRYITGRKKPQVRHVFQSNGEHVVYARVRDSRKLWSRWQSLAVEIE